MPDRTGNLQKTKEFDATWIGVLVILLGFGGMVIMFSNTATNTNKATSSRAEVPAASAKTCKNYKPLDNKLGSEYNTAKDYCKTKLFEECNATNYATDKTSWKSGNADGDCWMGCCRFVGTDFALQISNAYLINNAINPSTNKTFCGTKSAKDPFASCVSGSTCPSNKSKIPDTSCMLYSEVNSNQGGSYLHELKSGICCESVVPYSSPIPTPFQPHGTVDDCGDNIKSINCRITWGSMYINTNNADNKKNGVSLQPACVYDYAISKYVCGLELTAEDTMCDGKQYAYGVALINNVYDTSACLVTEKGTATSKSPTNGSNVCKFIHLGNAWTVTQCQDYKNRN